MNKKSTHIRIDTELKQELQAMARPGETVNDVIRRLITGTPAVNREVNTDVNARSDCVTTYVNNRLTDLYQRVDALETRMEILMQDTRVVSSPQKNTQSVPSPEEPGRDSEPDREEEKISYPGDLQVNTPGQEEWVVVTDEIRSQMIARVGELQEAGMTYEKIGKLINMGKGRISELHHGKMKKIRRSQYDALMRAT